jgi:hypothetical protein
MRLGENTANGEVEWIQNGRFENGLFFKDFSRRSGRSRLTPFSLIRQCFVIFMLSVVKYFAVSPVFHNLSGHP